MALLAFDDEPTNRAKIKVVGVGGGGGNAINTMIEARLEGVDFIACNTDVQALEANQAPLKLPLGGALTKGLGAGANPEVGRNSALEDVSRLTEVLGSADMVFVTAGMGGGTGTGAAPVIAQVARECGALTVGVVTKPFTFEGRKRRRQAEEGIAALQSCVDTLITIPNDRLLAVASQKTTMLDAFRKADEVLLNAVQGISDLITIPGLINVDFADVRTIMKDMGRALMGTGRASGERRALEAAQQAINSPLLEDVNITGATGILINITGGPDLTLFEVNEASTLIQEAAHEDANIIFGSVIDANLTDEVRITVIATGFDPAYTMIQVPQSAPVPQRGPSMQMAVPQVRPRQVTLPYVAGATLSPSVPAPAPIPPPPPVVAQPAAQPVAPMQASMAPLPVVSPSSVPVVDRTRHAEVRRDNTPVTAPVRPEIETRTRSTAPTIQVSTPPRLSDVFSGTEDSELDIPAFLRLRQNLE